MHGWIAHVCSILAIIAIAREASATSVFVGAVSGRVFRVDPDGSATLLGTASGPVGGLARAADGTIFVCESNRPVSVEAIASNGTVSSVGTALPDGRSCRDLVVTSNGRIFLLILPDGGATEVWEVFPSGKASQLLFDLSATIADGDALGFSLRSDGTLLLATQEQTFGRILAATLSGSVTTISPVSQRLLTDIATSAAGEVFVLSHELTGPNPNNRSIRRLDPGALTLVAGADAIGELGSRLAVGDPGEFFVVGGGFGTSIAFVQRITADGSSTVLRTFPDESLASIDDDHFDPSATPTEIPVIASLSGVAGVMMVVALAAALLFTIRRARSSRTA